MNTPHLPDDFVERLLAQDGFFASPELATHRREVVERLTRARNKERRARKTVLLACAGCVLVSGSIFGVAALQMTHASAWPEWVLILLALLFLLSPLTAVVVLGVYLLRYRFELVSARRAARSQALSEIPKQLSQLRRELDDLRKKYPKTAATPTDNAFTLMELLAVVAIITILSALLLPALVGVKARARIVTCKNNLGQLGKGLTMYESDFRFFPGAGNDLVRIAKPPWFVLSPESWLSKIPPYLAVSSAVFTCPDYHPLITNSQCYGYNAGGSCQLNYPPYNLGLGLGPEFGLIAPSSVKVPADMIAQGDLQLPSQVARFVISPWHKQPLAGMDSVIPPRHAGGAAMVFVDSHVEWTKRPNWINELPQARLRWNNDHQPHPETW